ncbi:hypothetical protein J1614_011647 [Plenodomus biglobosus]|nr:hypothetical protein J1614_011647 [Plenodomus biglobosus]
MGSVDDLNTNTTNENSKEATGKDETDGAPTQELDALIVGAGFGGVYQLKTLRDAGYKVKLVEQGSDYGGVWYWNRYPGARVDSATPHYGFSDPEIWKDWTWKQRFPRGEEIRPYFAHVAEKWDLRKDTQFDTLVSSATWIDSEARWEVRTKAGEIFKAKFFLLNTGFAAKRYIPDWKGIESFKGTFLHPSYWPHEDIDLKGKRVAIIGTGSTGIQLAEELSKVASQLTIFQRTPNMSLPMVQVDYNQSNPAPSKSEYPHVFAGRTESFTGFDFNFLPRSAFDDTPSQRHETYEQLWSKGDFSFWLASYNDILFSHAANLTAYTFWRDKTRTRIHDPHTAAILAPTTPPHAFGCKRVSLETSYFDIFNQPHVTLINTNTNTGGTPIQEITPTGLKTTSTTHTFDAIISATGYDAVTGGLLSIRITGTSGHTLAQHWDKGVKTYLGLAVAGFPNMFFTYGPQAPTALCNGPTCAELQGKWILDAMRYLSAREVGKIEVKRESEEGYREEVLRLAGETLVPGVDSWYMGANIPGKPREPLFYLGGVPTYYKMLNEVAEGGYTGFDLS